METKDALRMVEKASHPKEYLKEWLYDHYVDHVISGMLYKE